MRWTYNDIRHNDAPTADEKKAMAEQRKAAIAMAMRSASSTRRNKKGA